MPLDNSPEKNPTLLPDDEEWRRTFLKAADVIRERGWWQGGYCPDKSDGFSGPVCALGAINVAEGRAAWMIEFDRRRVYNKRVARGLCIEPGESFAVFEISVWNDTADRTAAEVIAGLEAAALAE